MHSDINKFQLKSNSAKLIIYESSWLRWIRKSKKQMLNINAVCWPFQFFDCHIKNHSPPIAINNVNQSITPMAKPNDNNFFECLNSWVPDFNFLIMLMTPAQTKAAMLISVAIMSKYMIWCKVPLLIARHPFFSFENTSDMPDTIFTNWKLEP